MKKIAFFLTLALAAAPLISNAAVQISEGNILQAPCGIPFSTDIRSVGVLTGNVGYLVKNKKVSTGQSISNGDLVFYVSVEKSVSFYSSKKDAEIKDKSPFTPDIKLDADRKYRVWGNYSMKNGQKFALLDVKGYSFAVVKEDGFLCSDVIMSDKGSVRSVGLPQSYQQIPFERIEEPVGDGNTISIAITLKEFDSVSVTLDVAVLVNGKVSSRKAVGYDLLSGSAADIGGLFVEMSRDSNKTTALKIKSISEPADYAVWLKNVFNIDSI